MYANNMLPEAEDRWLDLLTAVIELARRDTNRPTVPDPIKQEAHEFLHWARETLCEDDTPAF